jgi:hypothetical protein
MIEQWESTTAEMLRVTESLNAQNQLLQALQNDVGGQNMEFKDLEEGVIEQLKVM